MPDRSSDRPQHPWQSLGRMGTLDVRGCSLKPGLPGGVSPNTTRSERKKTLNPFYHRRLTWLIWQIVFSFCIKAVFKQCFLLLFIRFCHKAALLSWCSNRCGKNWRGHRAERLLWKALRSLRGKHALAPHEPVGILVVKVCAFVFYRDLGDNQLKLFCNVHYL